MTRRGDTSRADGRRGASQRQLRVAETLRKTLVEVLAREELHEAALAGNAVTVSEVRISPDLRHATCFVSLFGGGDEAAAVAALNRLAPWLGSRVAGLVRLKYACRLAFARDTRFEQANRIESLLRRPDVAGDLADGKEDGDDGA